MADLGQSSHLRFAITCPVRGNPFPQNPATDGPLRINADLQRALPDGGPGIKQALYPPPPPKGYQHQKSKSPGKSRFVQSALPTVKQKEERPCMRIQQHPSSSPSSHPINELRQRRLPLTPEHIPSDGQANARVLDSVMSTKELLQLSTGLCPHPAALCSSPVRAPRSQDPHLV